MLPTPPPTQNQGLTGPGARTRPVRGRWSRLRDQFLARNPFGGTLRPTRVPLLSQDSRRPTVPIPTPWNYERPLELLESFFWDADAEDGFGRHNRYLDVPGFDPILATRDPALIRAISAETGDKPGQFDRDTLPTGGIARATGVDTLLYANGESWKRQKKLATPPFARTTLFQPERFHDFERSFRSTAAHRFDLVIRRLNGAPGPLRVALEPEIKSVMLEMLVNNFFGAEVCYGEIRDRYVPALERVIAHIVRDTVINKLGIPLERLPVLTPGIARAKADRADFERLTDLVLSARAGCRGLWGSFRSDAPDAALRGNIRVFLAGALEATTSYAAWALSHLSRDPEAQERLHAEVDRIEEFSPENLDKAAYLSAVLNETLRLTPSLYFHPRRATVDTTIELSSGTLVIPRGTHILLDIWHANRHEDHWGVGVTGFPAERFCPQRWEGVTGQSRAGNDTPHFGFGHGPRFCPGKSLGQMEVALVVAACVKMFRFRAVEPSVEAVAGVSTKPGDGVLVDLWPRSSQPVPTMPEHLAPSPAPVDPAPSACPFSRAQRV